MEMLCWPALSPDSLYAQIDGDVDQGSDPADAIAAGLVYVPADRTDGFLASMGSTVGAAAGDVVCFGHTHVPWHRTVNGVHFVNTGSVGRPKDGDPRAGYVILDVEADRVAVEIVRVAYDVERTASAILASDLPDAFADYLRTGGRK